MDSTADIFNNSYIVLSAFADQMVSNELIGKASDMKENLSAIKTSVSLKFVPFKFHRMRKTDLKAEGI